MRSWRRFFAAMERGPEVLVRRTPYLEARVRLQVAEAGSITRKVKGSLRKSTLALGQIVQCNGGASSRRSLGRPGHEGRVPSNLPLGRGVRLNPETRFCRTRIIALHTVALAQWVRLEKSPQMGEAVITLD